MLSTPNEIGTAKNERGVRSGNGLRVAVALLGIAFFAAVVVAWSAFTLGRHAVDRSRAQDTRIAQLKKELRDHDIPIPPPSPPATTVRRSPPPRKPTSTTRFNGPPQLTPLPPPTSPSTSSPPTSTSTTTPPAPPPCPTPTVPLIGCSTPR